MGTKDFNIIDNILAQFRSNIVRRFVEKGDIILDFGCGHQAYFLKRIRNRIRLGIGIDYDIRNENIGKNIKLRKFRFIDKLPFLDNYFDKIVILAVIEHLEENQVLALFKECHRILRPNGIIILTTPTPFSKNIFEFLAFKLKIISLAEIKDHKKYYSKDNLLNIATSTKFYLEKYYTFQLGLNSFFVLKKI